MAHGGGPRQVKLDRESELRIEVGYDAPLKFRLLSGTAEIFGNELPPDIWLAPSRPGSDLLQAFFFP
ncbi:hypothetical protein ACFX13_045857 [Malus domestica]